MINGSTTKTTLSLRLTTLIRFSILLVFFTLALQSFSQLATEHHIPPLFGREDKGSHYIVLSTPSTTPFSVTITDGSGNLITTQTISNIASSTYYLGDGDTTEFLVTEAELNTVVTNEGLILTAPEAFYASIRVLAGPQAGSLTSKGNIASFGKDFRTGHLFNNDGQDWRKSNGFGIMATENNTTVNISDIRPGVIFRGTTPAGAPLTSPDVTVTLNAGECYVMAAFTDEAGATENTNGLNGTHITSDKNVVVNCASWLGGNSLVGGNPATGRDLGFDQIVPVEIIGDEYVLIKGEGIDNEKTIVVASQDNTDIFIDGNAVAVATINAGDYYVIDGASFSVNDNLYVTSSNPVYLYQTANGGDGTTDDNERQCGLNFLPPVGCSGGKSVVLPSVDFIGQAFINIIADVGANVYVNGTLLGSGDLITGTTDYVTYKLNNSYTGDITVTSDKLIRVALINLSGNIGAAGYFSGFTKDFSVQTNTVNGDNIALEGCIPASFTFGIDAPSSTPTVLNYQIMGTATNGIDYQYIDTSVTIPAGQTQASIIINAISDGIPEGQESIFIIYQPDLCSPIDTAFLYIDDAQPIEFTLDGTDLSCFQNNSGIIDVNATGGFLPYTYQVTDPQGNVVDYTSAPIPNLAAGTYTVQVYDVYGCKAQALIVGGVFDADTLFLPDGTGVTYTSQIPISGFGNGETIDSLSQIQQICATIEHSYMGDLEIKIIAPTGQSVILKEYPGGGSCDLGEPIATAPVDGAASSTLIDPGTGYQYCWNSSPNFVTMVGESNNYTRNYTDAQGHNYNDNYLPAGAYESFQPLGNLLGADMDGNWTMEVTDNLGLDNGYMFEWNISLVGALPDTNVTLLEPDSIEINGFITQAQCGGNDGEINLVTNGIHTPLTFAWSNGATTEDVTGLSAGTYYVIVTDTMGCSDSASFNLNNISSINITSTVTQVNCAGGNNGAIDVTTSGGTSPYTFSWSNGATTEDISNLTAGTYTLSITDASGCQFSEDVVVGSLPAISITLDNSSNEVCGTGNGSISISVSGGSGSYGYSWDNGASTEDLTNLSAGTYVITVTDANNCQGTASYTIVNDVSNCSAFCYLTVSSVVVDENCGDGTGSIDITVVDAAQPYIVSWSSGQTVEDISNLSAGTYTITVTDANQCVETATITVGNNTGNLSISSNQISNENCGNADGTIDITVAGGTLPYTFSWDNGATTEDISSLGAGNYTVTITDGNGCTFNNTFTIINNTGNLAATAAISNEICGNAAGAINLTVTGAAGTLSYLWSNGATTEDLTGLSAGLYSCTITDAAGGCVLVTPSYNLINESSTLLLTNTSVTNEDCNNGLGEIDITTQGGIPPLTYLWSNGATTEDITGLSAGTYSATVTDQNGCEVQTGTLNLFNAPGTLDITTDYVTNEICGNAAGAIFLTTTGGTAPITYSWNNGSTSEDITSLVAGAYSLTATDANGCTFNHNETVTNTSGTLQIDNAVVTDENCNDATGSIDIFISGGTTPFTYLWSNGATTEDITGLSANNYSVTITDNNGCEATNAYTINNNTGNLAVTSQGTAENCSNGAGAVDITVTGGTTPYTFLWNTGATTEDLTGINGGTYSCTITDGAGCIILTGNIVINNNPGNLVLTANSTDESCGDASGTITLNATGGLAPLTYVWNPNVSTTSTATGLAAGMYIYTVTDANSCTITDSTEILNNTGTLSLDNTSVTDEQCDDDMGAIDLTVSGGAAPITYLWSNTATTEDITNLNQGTYSCVITDNNGCTINTGNINVANNAGTLTIDNVQVIDEACGNALGAINITITGGATPYTFLWNTGATTEDLLTGLSAGNYTCDVTDANGCTVQVQATVQNSSGTLYTTSNIVTDESCSTGNGAINLNPLGGSTPYTFIWSNGATTEDISSLSAGTYNVTITDAAGCSIVESFTVNDNGANLLISNVTISDEMCGNLAGAIDITVQGGNTPFTFAWSNGNSLEDLSGVAAGNYSVIVTDANGCTTNGAFTINENNGALAIDTLVITDEICGDGNGALDLTMSTSSATPCCSYTLNMYDGNNNGWGGNPRPEVEIFINGSSFGTFSVPVGAGNSIQTETIPVCDGDILAVAYLPGSFNNSNSYDIVDASGTTIHADGPNPSGPAISFTTTAVCQATPPTVTYSWSNGATTEDISNLNAGTYTVTVTDANGCTVDTTGTIQNITGGFTASLTGTTDENCGDTTGTVDITVAGGTLPYTFAWDNGATTEDLSNLSAGTYNVVVTDAAGCSFNLAATVNNISGSLTITNAVTNDENCGDGTGYIDLTVNGTSTPFTYAWSNGATSQDLSALSAGTYTVTITDAGGCMVTQSYVINNNGGGLNSAITMNDETCGNSDGNITVVASGGLAPYVISWVGGTPTNCCTYTLNMQDQGNSWNGAAVQVFINSALIGSYTVPGGGANTETFNVCDGDNVELYWNPGGFDNEVSFDLLDASGTTIFTQGASPTPGLLFTTTGSCPANSGNTSSLTNISAGTYYVTVSEAGGCSVTDTIVVNDIYTFSTAGAVTDESCSMNNGAIDLTTTSGTTPFTFAWSNSATTEDLTGIGAGTYTVTTTDASGCAIIDTFTVSNNVTFTTSSNITDDNCNLGSGAIDMTMTGGTAPFTFVWSNGLSTEDITGLSAGSYIVTSTDASGCSVIDTIVVGNTATFTTAGTITNDVCGANVGAIDMTITGGTAPFTFVWSNAATTEDLTGIGAGTYTVTTTDDLGCSVKDTFVVTNTTVFTITNNITNDSCGLNSGAIDINVSGGSNPFTFLWSNGATTADISNLSSGTYSVTVTDGSGCTDVAVYVVNSSSSILSSGTIVNDTCGLGNGSIDLTISGGGTPCCSYTLQMDDTFGDGWDGASIDVNINGALFGNFTIPAGQGNFTVTEIIPICDGDLLELTYNSGNFENEHSYTLFDANSGVAFNATAPPTTGNVYSANASCSAIPPVVTYNWSNGATTEDISNLVAGTYMVTIVDTATGCTKVDTFTVDNITTFTAFGVSTDDTCNLSVGTVDLTIAGGTTPFTFAWSNGATTEDVTGLNAGTHSVTITDASGCTETQSFTINNIATFNYAADIGNDSCGMSLGYIDLSLTGGTAPFTFAWNNGETTEDISTLTEGTYIVNITDASGCSAIDSFVVNNVTLYTYTAVLTGDSCNQGNGAIDLTIVGGSTPFTFAWSNGATTEDLSGLSTGNYSVVITDASGCSKTENYNISSTASFNSSGIITDDNCNNGTGAIDLSVANNTSCCSYTLNMFDQGNSWNGASINVLIDGSSIGTFTVPGGGQNVETFTVCNGESIELIWNSGAFDNEVFFNLADASGTTIFTQGPSPTPGSLFTSTGSCPSTSPTVNYVWSNGATTEDISGLNSGTYIVTITDANGCSILDTFVVNNIATFTYTDVTTSDTCNSGVGAIDLSLTGGTAPITFVWSNGATTEDISSLNAGTYSVTMTDANGCSSVESFTVNNIASFTYSDVTTSDTCNSGVGAIDLSISGGTAPFTFAWSNGATTEDLSGLNAGTFSVTITDASGCTALDSFTINNIATFNTTSSITSDTCNSGVGAIDLTLTGGTTPFTFAWSNGATTEDISGLSIGSYSVTITDASGCSKTENFTIISTASFSSSGTITNDNCNNGTGAIDLSVANSNPCCSYTLNMYDGNNNGWGGNPAPEVEVFINSASIGTFTILPGAGNSFQTENLPICDGDLLEVEWLPGAFNTTCSYDIVDASGTVVFADGPNPSAGINYTATAVCPSTSPVLTYSWSNGATTEDISGLNAGTYSVTITDTNGCSVLDTFTVNNTATFTYSNITTNDVCNSGVGTIDLSFTGGTSPFTFAWSNGATTEDLSGLNAGTYSVTMTDASGCTAVDSFIINNTNTFTHLSSVTDDNCNSAIGAIDLSLTGGSAPITFAWSNGATTEDLSGLNAGTYSVTITDASGCTAVDSFTVNNIATFTYSDVTISDTCNSAIGSIDLTLAGGTTPFTFAWSNGATTEDLSGLNAGIYTVTITDASGCSAVDSYTINNIATFTYSNVTTSDTCNSGVGAIDLTLVGGTAPFTFAWSNGATTEDLSGLNAGTYSVTITDASGCSAVDSFTINNIATFTYTNVTISDTCNSGVGAIDLTLAGGTAPFTFAWSNGATTEDLSGLNAGVYNVTITDASGCIALDSFTINNIATFTYTDVTISDTCNSAVGAIDLTLAGGTAPFTFAWSNGATTEDLSGLNAGIYNVTITDASGCVTLDSFTINNIATFTYTDVTISDTCNLGVGAIDLSLNGGTAPFTFAWSNGATTEDLSGLNAGTYTVTITDASGCAAVDSFTVNNMDTCPLPVPSFSSSDSTLCEGECINFTDLSTNTPTGWTWYFTGSSQPVVTGTATPTNICYATAGNYPVKLVVSNPSGSDSLEIVGFINVLASPTITTNTDTAICDGTSIELNATGGVTYAWDNGLGAGQSHTVSPIFATTYTVVGTDANGCTSTDSVVVSINALPVVVASDDTLICIGTSATISVTGASTYNWDNSLGSGSSHIVLPDVTTTYTVIGTDTNGCTNIDDVTVMIDDESCLNAPTAFSPNGDGKNDVWMIRGLEEYPDIVVKVFNRWGSEMYSSDVGYTNPWDGKYGGADVTPATYYYIIELGNGEEPRTGTVNIIR